MARRIEYRSEFTSYAILQLQRNATFIAPRPSPRKKRGEGEEELPFGIEIGDLVTDLGTPALAAGDEIGPDPGSGQRRGPAD